MSYTDWNGKVWKSFYEREMKEEKKMASIYEIDQAILECIDQETGEVLDGERLDQLNIDREKKIEGIALWYKNEVAEAAAIKAEKDALAERQQKHEKRAESLKNYLKNVCEGRKFETPKVAISYRKSTSVEITNDDAIPHTYKVAQWKVDKASLKDALKNGKHIPGAFLVENSNVQIK